MYITTIGLPSYRITYISRLIITLIKPAALILYIYISLFKFSSVLYRVTATMILHPSLYQCMTHLSWSVVTYSLIFSRLSSSFLKFPFAFLSSFLIFEDVTSFFNHIFLWNKYLGAELHWEPSLYVRLRRKCRLGAPFESWPLSARRNIARVYQIVDPNNLLRDIREAQCRVLAKPLGNGRYDYARGIMTVHYFTTFNPEGTIYAAAMHEIRRHEVAERAIIRSCSIGTVNAAITNFQKTKMAWIGLPNHCTNAMCFGYTANPSRRLRQSNWAELLTFLFKLSHVRKLCEDNARPVDLRASVQR